MINNSSEISKEENIEKKKNKSVEIPPSLYTFYKENNKQLIKLEHTGGKSLKGKTYIMQLKSTLEETYENYIFRQLEQNSNFEWEFFISKAMGELGVSPKIIHENHKDKYYMMDFIENSIYLRPRFVPNDECLRQIGVYLRKIHEFSPAKKPPDSFSLLSRVINRLKKNIERLQILSRFLDYINIFKQLLKVFEKNCERCLCHNDFGYGGNLLWDKKRIWVVDWEHSGTFYPYYDIGSTISLLLFSNNRNREIFLNSYYGRPRTEKEEALVYVGETYGLLQYGIMLSSIIFNVPDNINEKFFDDILEWNSLSTGKMKLEKNEFGTNIGNIKIATMIFKQVDINMSTQKFKNSMKLLNN